MDQNGSKTLLALDKSGHRLASAELALLVLS